MQSPPDIVLTVSSTPFAEGKTKRIFSATTGNLEIALVQSGDVITAGDGFRRATMPGKGGVATATTSNIFRLLEKHGIATHFVSRDQANSFIAHQCKMIPVECVARRIAFGSYLKRNPAIAKGLRFPVPMTELFFKDDARHDPLLQIKHEPSELYLELYEPGKPVGESSRLERILLSDHHIANLTNDADRAQLLLQTMQRITREVFEVIEDAFKKQGVMLVDLKIEFGFDPYGRLVVADVIDNDSWRIWPDGDEMKMLDKQVFRDKTDPTPEDLERILGNYITVADITSRF